MGKHETIDFYGRAVRKFIPYPTSVRDGTLRCIVCGQIDDEPWHDPALCSAFTPSSNPQARHD